MRMNKSVEKQVPAPDIQRRINAGWLRLWRTVWPNTPPPRTVQSLEPAKSKVSGLESKVPTLMGGVQSPKSNVQSQEAGVQGSRFKVQGSKFSLSPSEPRPAAVGYRSEEHTSE